MTTAKLFQTGGSQAVRLPKEFRFEGTEVEITRQGNTVQLRPLAPAKSLSNLAFLEHLSSAFPHDDKEQASYQDTLAKLRDDDAAADLTRDRANLPD